jgi:hypothetical protein
MALMQEVELYGFGSFFKSNNEFRDIDILILHQSTLYESCKFSLWCKKYLLANLAGADITILSKSEERQLTFIEKSKAKYLGNVNEGSAKNDLDIILSNEIGVKI